LIFLPLLTGLAATSKGYFLKVMCGTFTSPPFCGAYLTQNMYGSGKF